MVRYKKRYFVLQLDRHHDVLNQPNANSDNSSSSEPQKKKKKGQKLKHHLAVKKRSLCDPKPLLLNDGQLSQAIKDIVHQMHGDFGRAAVTMGKTINFISVFNLIIHKDSEKEGTSVL